MQDHGGFDHVRATFEVERAHGRATESWRAPFWLLVVGLVLAVGVLVGMVVLAAGS